MADAKQDARRGWAWFAGIAVALGTSYGISPLFSSNQNHHFLIGLARAGDGWLADDWLSHTADPFPIFSALVELAHRTVGDGIHYALYYALFGLYGYALLRVVEYVWPVRTTSANAERLMFLAALCVMHNEAIGYLLGIDLRHMPWWQLTHWGVAEQEIFGHGAFQASSFGMVLPLAIALFLAGRPLIASSIVAAVVAMHFSYALTAMSVVAAFTYVQFRRTGRAGPALAVALIAILIAGPVAVDVYRRLGPSTPEASTAAATILVQHLPQEAVVSQWFAWKAAAQIVLMLSSFMLTAGTDLFVVLVAPFLAGSAGTIVQVVTGSPRIALLFPWRVSVLLVPIASALLLRRGIVALVESFDGARVQRWARFAAAALVVSVMIGGVRMTLQAAYFYDDSSLTRLTDRVVPARWRADFRRALRPDSLPMARAVREDARPGNLYLIPPDLERFRLVAGVPVLADRKSHPYKDVEVIDWRRRLDLVEAVYAAREPCTAVKSARDAFPITHIVADDRIRALRCAGWVPVYSDPAFVVFQIAPVADVK